jgi:hypothetical protein
VTGPAGSSGPAGPPLEGLLAWYFSTQPVDGTTVPDKVGARHATASSSVLDGKTVWDDAGVTIALPAEATLLAADKWGFLFSTGDAPLTLVLPAQRLADPYNPASWSTSSSAVLSIPSEGVLRIAYGGYTNPTAYQTILTAGKIFRVMGEGRSDGTARPSVQDNTGAFLWTGTSSTGWQPFCIEDVAAGTRIQFKALMVDDNYCEFRNIRVELVISSTERALRTNTGNMIFARIEDDQARDILVYDAPLAGEALALARDFVGDTSPAWIAPLLTTMNRYGFDPVIALAAGSLRLPIWFWGDRTWSTGADPGGHTYSATGPWQAMLGAPGLYGDVTELNAAAAQLSGAINPDLGNLAALQTLHLSNNQLTGSVPASFGNLAALQSLRLLGNQLDGIEAGAFGGLVSIQELRINENGLIQSAVGAILDEIYANKEAYTDTGYIDLFMDGSNAKPSGVYQYAATPSTPLEKAYALEHPWQFGSTFNRWTITYTGE